MLRRPPRITDKGLEGYLNDTAKDHNGYGYSDFIKNQKLGKAGLAKLFGVDRSTIYNWLKVYELEKTDVTRS